MDNLLTLAALGELTSAQGATLDRIATGEPLVATELDAMLRTAATVMRLTIDSPPPSLKQNVLLTIAAEAQDVPVPLIVPGTIPNWSDTAVPLTAHRRRWPAMLSAAAAVIACFAVAITLVATPDDAPTFASVVEAPDAQIRTFDGALEGQLEVVVSARSETFALDGRDVPQLGPDEVYRLWFIDGGEAVLVGDFRPHVTGRVMETFAMSVPPDAVIGVTIESIDAGTGPTWPALGAA